MHDMRKVWSFFCFFICDIKDILLKRHWFIQLAGHELKKNWRNAITHIAEESTLRVRLSTISDALAHVSTVRIVWSARSSKDNAHATFAYLEYCQFCLMHSVRRVYEFIWQQIVIEIVASNNVTSPIRLKQNLKQFETSAFLVSFLRLRLWNEAILVCFGLINVVMPMAICKVF